MMKKIFTLTGLFLLSIPLTSFKNENTTGAYVLNNPTHQKSTFCRMPRLQPEENFIQPAKKNPEKSSVKPLKELLKPDGTIDLNAGFSGALNIADYKIKIDPVKGVVASPEGPDNTTALCNRTMYGFNGGGDGALPALVRAIAVSGTNVYVGGDFTKAVDSYYGDYIMKWDGAKWTVLGNNISILNNSVYAITVMGSDVYAGGTFTGYAAKWNGSTWTTMTGLNNNVFALANDGSTVYAGGAFFDANGFAQADYIAQWVGSSWFPVGSDLAGSGGACNNAVNSIAVSGGNVYVGGFFTNMAGLPKADKVAKWDGSGWSALGSNIAGTDGAIAATIRSVAVSGTDVYVGGDFTDAAGIAQADFIAKWNGTIWSALGSNVAGTNGALTNVVFSVATDGLNVYVGGLFLDVRGIASADNIVKWDGTNWSNMGSNGANGAMNNNVYVIAISGSNVYAGGTFTNAAGDEHNDYICRWSGSSWNYLNTSNAVNNDVKAITINGGFVYIGGDFTNCGGIPQADYIARWDGTNWAALGSNIAGTDGAFSSPAYISTIAISGSDLYAGGYFSNVAGNSNAQYIAKWNGTAWSSLGSFPALNANVFAITIMGTDVYAAGGFTNAAGNANADYVAKWNGTAWSNLGTNAGGTNGALFTAARGIANDGTNVYVGGDFTDAGGNTSADYIAKWNGTTWQNLGSSGSNGVVTGPVQTVTVDGSNVYIGGVFWSGVSGVAGTRCLAKWNGTVWSSVGGTGLDPAAQTVNAIVVSGADVYVGGYFATAGTAGNQSAWLAVWNGSTWTDVVCDPSGGVSGIKGIVQAIGVTSTTTLSPTNTDDRLYVGLDAITYGLTGSHQKNLLRMIPNALLPISLEHFEVSKINERENRLQWNLNCTGTTSKTAIQKSTDGVNFTTVDIIPDGCGNHLYSDKNVFAGKNYYRLKTEHDGGMTMYSSIRLVVNGKNSSIVIYPNPAKDIINIAGWNNVKSMQWFDISGRKLNVWQEGRQALEVNKYSSGTYVLKVELKSGEIIEQKVVLYR